MELKNVCKLIAAAILGFGCEMTALAAQAKEVTFRTNHGFVFTQVRAEPFGVGWKTPDGTVWGSRLPGTYSQYDAITACQRQGGVLPGVEDFQQALAFFTPAGSLSERDKAELQELFPDWYDNYWTANAVGAGAYIFERGRVSEFTVRTESFSTRCVLPSPCVLAGGRLTGRIQTQCLCGKDEFNPSVSKCVEHRAGCSIPVADYELLSRPECGRYPNGGRGWVDSTQSLACAVGSTLGECHAEHPLLLVDPASFTCYNRSPIYRLPGACVARSVERHL